MDNHQHLIALLKAQLDPLATREAVNSPAQRVGRAISEIWHNQRQAALSGDNCVLIVGVGVVRICWMAVHLSQKPQASFRQASIQQEKSFSGDEVSDAIFT